MALEDSGTAPYAPVRAITTVIDQYRDKSIPTPVTTAVLTRVGIEQSLAQRTLAALKQLDLIEKSGEPTETLKKLRTAPTAQFQETKAEWLRAAYKPIFTYVDPGADVQRIADQFRHYEPAGMRNRMVTLFLGLCAYAGLVEEVPPIPRPAKRSKEGAANGRTREQRRPPRQDKPVEEASAGTSHARFSSPSSLDSARQQYVEMLLAKAAEQAEPDAELLDRIERALGISDEKEKTP